MNPVLSPRPAVRPLTHAGENCRQDLCGIERVPSLEEKRNGVGKDRAGLASGRIWAELPVEKKYRLSVHASTEQYGNVVHEVMEKPTFKRADLENVVGKHISNGGGNFNGLIQLSFDIISAVRSAVLEACSLQI